ncbi:MAG: hypothetical protein A3F10_04345 [Coxiella sp. RIFCSPHIGHO2_12_FULL_42_15]|nr:MAG: hypothetical protein A3F10_04345 [Coxiella sp. RIFCSPHIGHO2_12_FULL_42_15]
MTKHIHLLISFVMLTLLLTSCSTLHKGIPDGPPTQSVDITKVKDPVPHPLKLSHYGNPSSYVIEGKRYYVLKSARGYHEQGIASWYGRKFHGHSTSSGEPYDMLSMTAASRTLPIPVFARVTNLENGRSVIVRVNDRGPFAPGRIIDLSYVAAKKLGYADKGTTHVDVTALTFDAPTKHIQFAAQTRKPHLYLQVGAFRKQMLAAQLQSRLAKLTHQRIVIQTLHYLHHPIYRVQIGPLAGVKESDKLQQLLKAIGLFDPIAIIS